MIHYDVNVMMTKFLRFSKYLDCKKSRALRKKLTSDLKSGQEIM